MSAKTASTTKQNTAIRGDKPSLKNLLSKQDTVFKEYLEANVEDFKKFLKSNKIPRPVLEIDAEDRPRYPKDPTALSDEDLGRHYAKFVAWLSYVAYKMATASAEVIYYQLIEEKASKLLLSEYLSQGYDMKRSKLESELDPEFLAIQELLALAKARKASIEGIHSHYDNCTKGLSREISRRRSDDSQPFTGNSLGK